MNTATIARPLSSSTPTRRSPLQFVADVLRCAFEMKRALGATTNPTSPETVAKLRAIAERY